MKSEDANIHHLQPTFQFAAYKQVKSPGNVAKKKTPKFETIINNFLKI